MSLVSFDVCSWRHVCIPSLMSFGTPIAACLMAVHYLHFSTSSHKVSSLVSNIPRSIWTGVYGLWFYYGVW